jgi:phosphoglycolate phosphatase-like HAD superfamily hydrolase
MITVYLFDIDGTILLTGGAGIRAFNRVFAERYGVEGAANGVRAGGKTDPRIVDEICREVLGRAPTDGEIDEILCAYVPELARELRASPGFRVMPGAIFAIETLTRTHGVLLGLATGNLRAGARLKLEHIGVWERFVCGGFGDDAPDRAGLVARAIERARVAAQCPVPAERIAVVGDTPADVAAARACGVRVVAVPTGSYDRAALVAAGADVVLETLADLPAWHEADEARHAARVTCR